MKISTEELREICSMVIKLTELRQKGCNHLCIENFAPELMAKILEVYCGRAIVEYGAHDLIKGKRNASKKPSPIQTNASRRP